MGGPNPFFGFANKIFRLLVKSFEGQYNFLRIGVIFHYPV